MNFRSSKLCIFYFAKKNTGFLLFKKVLNFVIYSYSKIKNITKTFEKYKSSNFRYLNYCV